MGKERKQGNRKEKAEDRLTDLQIENFIFGYNFLCKDVFKTQLQRKNKWLEHRDHILSSYRDRRSDKDRTHLPLRYDSGTRPESPKKKRDQILGQRGEKFFIENRWCFRCGKFCSHSTGSWRLKKILPKGGMASHRTK